MVDMVELNIFSVITTFDALSMLIVELTNVKLYILIFDAFSFRINETVDGMPLSYEVISTGALIFIICPEVRLFKSSMLLGAMISDFKFPSSSK